MKSVNNKIIVELYKESRGVTPTINKGFASIKQKQNLVGLKVLCDATIVYGQIETVIKKGDVVYFTEETLYNSPWAKNALTSDAFKGTFAVAEGSQVILVKEGA